MPGATEHYNVTTVGVATCAASTMLDRLLKEPTLALDVHVVRTRVAREELYPQEGIDLLNEQGTLKSEVETDLKKCLGYIISGKCTIYRKN